MLEDNIVVKCVEDNEMLGCDKCCFEVSRKHEYQCGNFQCLRETRPDYKDSHFEIVNETCDRCGKEVVEGDAICVSCKIEELSNLF